MRLCIHRRELSAEQKYLRRVVHPDQNDHERPGGPIGDADITLAKVQADEELSDGKNLARPLLPH
jgi:hypothetical protein